MSIPALDARGEGVLMVPFYTGRGRRRFFSMRAWSIFRGLWNSDVAQSRIGNAMDTFRRTALTWVMAASCMYPAVQAHHSFAAEFDRNKPITLEGTVTKIEWQNPHIRFYVDVPDASGAMINWELELGSPNGLLRAGWTRNTLQPGEKVRGRGLPGERRLASGECQPHHRERQSDSFRNDDRRRSSERRGAKIQVDECRLGPAHYLRIALKLPSTA